MPVATNNLSADNFFSTTLSSGISASDTTIPVNSVPTASEGYLVIEPDSSTNREIIYYTSKTGSAVVCPSAALGRGVGGTSAASHSANVTIQGNVTAQHWLALQDASAMTGLHTYFDESFNDYVVSGATVSLATGLIASVSAGTVYINGRRLSVSAFSKTLTASKETYFDLIETDGSNIATVSYTELNSGVTGSAPVANGMHIGMVRSNASLLATIYQNGLYDYLINPLKQETPDNISTLGAWKFFEPKWTNLTVGNGTNIGYFMVIGRTVHWYIYMAFGSTSAMGSNPQFKLPVTASTTWGTTAQPQLARNVIIIDNGSNLHPAEFHYTNTAVTLFCEKADSTYLYYGGVTSTVPMTWTTADKIVANGTYEAAA